MHRDDIDATLAAKLVAEQFPEWAELPVEPVQLSGWDNRTFRLGDELLVRLPSAEAYVASVAKEHEWLPRLAPQLPVRIPEPVALGAPGAGYPWPWSVRRWIAGRPAEASRIADLTAFAQDLAGFLNALMRVDPTGGPAAGPHNFHRGGPPAFYDGETRAALRELAGRIDTAAATAIWEAALDATWTGDPVWFHGDVAFGNLLVDDAGRLTAVIDFGTSGVGDPACDLVVAWTLLDGPARAAFRAAMPADEAMWARARGWALWKALITLADPGSTRWHPESQRVLDLLLAERG
ncbi:aminoglycoside phosphotransferase family protein [Pseudonocardia sp. CA-107938]|uniref:aminoglycoside phosphotransferase family protein n=1 Tax=Pseudonocardia sp. CA-107938 TaxID=3240021 RepID=UPI003D91B6E8